MELSMPLIADMPKLIACIYIEKDKFRVELDFKNVDHKNEHIFYNEKTMFEVLKKYSVEPEHFKLSPF